MPRLVAALVVFGQVVVFAGTAPQQRIRSSVQLIVQTVTVLDGQGRPIEGLSAKDFVVTEDDQPQTVAFVDYQRFDTTALPAVQSPARPIESVDVPSTQGQSRYSGRRLLVLYIDLYNMPLFDQLRTYAHADRYVATQMTPADLVQIVVFENGRLRVKQEFTDDRTALREVIESLRSATDGDEPSIADAAGAFGEDDDTFALFTTDRQLAALQTAVSDLAPFPEIKTLVYLGSGLRLTGADNLAQLRATVNAAVRANVTINPIDTRGLNAAPPLGDARRASPSGIGVFSGAIAQAAVTRQQQSQDTYYALAKDTGGRAFFDSNDLALGIAQAAQAVTSYYIIGYYATNPAKDGRFRRVKITLANRDGARLSYRAGYYAAKEFAKFNAADKERQLEEALRLEDPITEIPIAIEVNYFQVSSAEYFVPVSVRMPGSELTRPRPSGDTRVVIDMIGEIKDEHGVTVRNLKDKLAFELDAATAATVSRRPIQYESGFTLLPGRYAIKVLARDSTTGRIGTFLQSFTVPNLERERLRLPISSVILTSQRVVQTDTLHTVRQTISADVANPLVAGGQRLVPSVTRTFTASEPLVAFLQAYQRDAAVQSPLIAFVSLYGDGAKSFETAPLAVRDGWDPKSRAVPITFTLSFSSLPAGTYECQVTVLDPASQRAAFWRAPIVLTR
jgi:VWFA-related protein